MAIHESYTCQGSSIKVVHSDEDMTAEPNAMYAFDTSGGSITVTLPASPAGNSFIHFCDMVQYFGTNALVVLPGAGDTIGRAASKVLTSNGQSLMLLYMDSTSDWLITGGG